MSLRDKYTDEEWNAIPPFTGFHHNKIVEEISKAISLGVDKLKSIPQKKDKVNLWDFSGGMCKDNDIHIIPENHYKLAENISVEEMLIDKVKKENQPRELIEKIVDKVYEIKANNKDCEVAIMSISDYDAIQSMHDFKIEQIEVMGYKLKIHSSLNLEDGEIEIY